MQKFENLEYADELLKIQEKFCEGSLEEPLNSDEIDTLMGILRRELEIINGENAEKLDDEEVLELLKQIQHSFITYENEDVLKVLKNISNNELRAKALKEYNSGELDTTNCWDMFYDMFEEFYEKANKTN